MPADDLTDPAPATTFAHLDATTVLSRSIAELGIYPAVDPLDSTSRMLNARILGQEHYDCARGVQRVLQARPVGLVPHCCEHFHFPLTALTWQQVHVLLLGTADRRCGSLLAVSTNLVYCSCCCSRALCGSEP